MSRRWISLLMAAVMLWIGVATHEAAWADTAHCAQQQGSVVDHHLDDAPGQAGSSAESTNAALALPATPWPALQPTAGERPRAPMAPSLRDAPDKGPFRPPQRP
jgi:hypothetical protein